MSLNHALQAYSPKDAENFRGLKIFGVLQLPKC